MSAHTITTAQTTRTTTSRLEVGGILLMAAGDGYINGNFIQPINTGFGVFIDIVHFIPLALLVWLGLLRLTDEGRASIARRRGMRVGVTILAVLMAITCLVMIALGMFVPSLGVGVQEFSDWLAVILAGGWRLAVSLPMSAPAEASAPEGASQRQGKRMAAWFG